MPQEDKEAYIRLRSSISQGIVGSKEYWVLSAKGLGLTDTPDGIFFEDGRHAEGTIAFSEETLGAVGREVNGVLSQSISMSISSVHVTALPAVSDPEHEQ
eukprot:6393123-Ditylum_brightwellii.AAC.1